MMELVAGDIDVAEIYSPPRVAKLGEFEGFNGGWFIDATAKDSDGRPWDSASSMMGGRAINTNAARTNRC